MKRSLKGWVGGGVLGLAAAGGLAALYAASLGREQVQLDRYTVRSARQGLPQSGLTILHLTDFHFRAGGRVQARKLALLQKLLRGESYDIVALTGDLIHDMAGLHPALKLIRTLSPRYGIYFVPGNHDYAEYTPWGVFDRTWRESTQGGLSLHDVKHVLRSLTEFVRKVVRNELVRMPVCFNDVSEMIVELERAGVRSLVNTSTRLSMEGGELWLAGIDDEMESHPDLAQAFDGIPAGVPLILLAHNPDIWLQCGVDRADLVLSGHTHGGQIQLPVMGAVHTQGTHLRRKAPAGWFERGHSKMFVSRGLGESIPLRFGARPQVALITLLPG
ncbi:MAG: metallophosphoesterase [Nitrososphaerales archaeon]